MLIHYTDGRVREGITMALTGGVMRVALRDEDDVVEFRLINDRWVCEDCEPVTFEFPIAVFEAVGIVPPAPGMSAPPRALDPLEMALDLLPVVRN